MSAKKPSLRQWLMAAAPAWCWNTLDKSDRRNIPTWGLTSGHILDVACRAKLSLQFFGTLAGDQFC
jgi:hypothetical protein